MTTDLVARFEKRFHGGPTIDVDFVQSTTGFSVTAMIGPSGCGKTTMLRCLAGLMTPDHGTIQFCDRTWFNSGKKTDLSPQQRDIGFLFQGYALFPHLTVEDNIGFGLRSFTEPDRRNRVAEIIRQFDLKGLEQRLPRQISGGQQQRVALGRVLARRPRLLLLDEPLSALDTMLREQLRVELRQTLGEFKAPVILVTHDRVEAISLADRVAVMDAGKIEQIGSIQDVFSRPKNERLARIAGVETVAAGEILESHEGLVTVQVGSASLLAIAPTTPTRMVYVCIKGEDVSLSTDFNDTTTVRNQLPAIIRSLTPEGPLIRVVLDCGFDLTALITSPASEDLKLKVGTCVTAMIKAPAIHLIPRAI
jgi:molybdate transport system ATP-binding protein